MSSTTPYSSPIARNRDLSSTVVENDTQRPIARNNDRSGVINFPTTTPTATQTSSGNASTSTQISSDVRSLMHPEEIKDKRCWICFGEESDSVGKWVRPCKCSLICHEECLLAWITENQKSTALKKVRCPQCRTLYHLAERASLLLRVFSIVDSAIQSSIPYFTIFGVTFAIAVTNIHYGAYAVITMVGLEDGERLLEEPWSWRVCFTLPLVPILLIFSRARIADPVMPLIPMLFIRYDQLRTTMPLNPSLTISLLPWARIVYNYSYNRLFGRLEQSWRRQLEPYSVATDSENGENGNERRRDQDVLDRLDRSNAGRKIIGALCLPFISAMVGSFLGRFSFIRSRIPDTFHRNVLGGCLFIVIKDIMNLTYKYQRAKHRRSRHIKNYTEFAGEELTSNIR
ncbi:2661_t:CDS:2 [Scutellospora calospora]|uniref:2661_t:CDS:1 n=1 Tax=Scutellospora calospora TaxID=85575 RepID=A0ACA9L4H0_9GLOM|nr:2661_t:CDS:2 [Scutellospora calospora]